jgi:hypothetical protein
MNLESNIPRIYSTLQDAGLWRIYTPADADDEAYEHDIEWFSMYCCPERRSSIRPRLGLEIFMWPYAGNVLSPPVWVWVIKQSPGFHVALPIWRGPRFFRTRVFKNACVADVGSDSEIAMLLYECSRRVTGSISELYGKAGGK